MDEDLKAYRRLWWGVHEGMLAHAITLCDEVGMDPQTTQHDCGELGAAMAQEMTDAAVTMMRRFV